jgi:MraZ protein
MDPKGRIAIPARFKDPIHLAGGRVFITRFDEALFAYPPPKWNQIEKKFRDFQETTLDMLSLSRHFLGGAVECVSDNQNRILIPKELRQYAKLEKNIVLVGLTDYFQIWSRKGYKLDTEKWMGGEVDEHAKGPKSLEVRNFIAQLVI